MCPDHQLLSVYLDGEMPSPWKEKLETHLAGCSLCAAKLESYRNLSIKSDAEDDAAVNAAQDRVWQKLSPQSTTVTFNRRVRQAPRMAEHLWQRRVSIPLPAVAAIAAILIAWALLFIQRTPGTSETQDMTIASETEFDVPGIIPVSDMESVLRYLGSRDNDEMIILQLPESRNFVNYSEPAIIRAADYSRQLPGRPIPDRQSSTRSRP